jgi:L-malate glycosyltransferase
VPIRVLHIASGDLWAGAEACVYELLKSFAQNREVNTYLIVLNHGRLEEACRSVGIATVVIDEKANSFLSILVKAVHVARKIRPDIIHGHRYKENVIGMIVSYFCAWPKLITTQHGLPEWNDGGLRSRLRRITTICYMGLGFHKAVGVSNDVASFLGKECRVPSRKVVKILNGFSALSYSFRSEKPKGQIVRIGSAGRLFPVKDFGVMVDVALAVCKEREDVHFVLAGEGPERGRLENKIHRYGLDKQFSLLGNLNDMPSFYCGIDIYINTSFHEGIPMSVLEAMSFGVPVVGFAVGGLKEIISDGTDGLLIHRRDSSAFAFALVELIKDYGILREMGRKAHDKIVDAFSAERMAEEYLRLYLKTLSEEKSLAEA